MSIDLRKAVAESLAETLKSKVDDDFYKVVDTMLMRMWMRGACVKAVTEEDLKGEGVLQIEIPKDLPDVRH